jgi:hypothetical protein
LNRAEKKSEGKRTENNGKKKEKYVKKGKVRHTMQSTRIY